MLKRTIPRPRNHPPLPPEIAAANLARLRGGDARGEDCELVEDKESAGFPEPAPDGRR